MRTPEAMASTMPTILNSLGRVTDLAAADVALAVADAIVLTIFRVEGSEPTQLGPRWYLTPLLLASQDSNSRAHLSSGVRL